MVVVAHARRFVGAVAGRFVVFEDESWEWPDLTVRTWGASAFGHHLISVATGEKCIDPRTPAPVVAESGADYSERGDGAVVVGPAAAADIVVAGRWIYS